MTQGQYTEPPQIGKIASQYQVVTLTLGGDDTEFASILGACLQKDELGSVSNIFNTTAPDNNGLLAEQPGVAGQQLDCSQWISTAGSFLTGPEMTSSLFGVYEQMLQEMSPTASLLVGNYPPLFPSNPPTTCVVGGVNVAGFGLVDFQFPGSLIPSFNGLQSDLNADIDQAVAEVQATGDTRIQLVDLADDLAGHGVSCGQSGQPEPYINGVDVALGDYLAQAQPGSSHQYLKAAKSDASFHPDQDGQAAMAEMFGAEATSPVPLSIVTPPASSISAQQLVPFWTVVQAVWTGRRVANL